MIKLGATLEDGSKVAIFGLSKMNIERLQEGKPIRIDMQEVGGTGTVIIMAGETEDSITAEIFEHFDLPKA